MAAVLLAATASASIVEFQWHLQRTLRDEGSTAVDCQRAIAALLGQAASFSGSILVNGEAVDGKAVASQTFSDHMDSSVVRAQSITVPASSGWPVTLSVPRPADGHVITVYQRIGEDVYIRVPPASGAYPAAIGFLLRFPGEYIVAEEEESPESPPAGAFPMGDFFDFSPVSAAPEAKAAWDFYPVAPDVIAGPVPLILIHGMVSDRWNDFAHWAEHSDEAAAFREHFQLWNFSHPGSGVTAPIGFSTAYPSFSESVVAYLARFIQKAEANGVESGGKRYVFPSGPYALLTHSAGGLKARAFLVNYPEHAQRVFAVVTLACPHMGTPWGTPEWVRHTLSGIGFTREFIGEKIFQGLLAELTLNGYFNMKRQGDLDVGWANYDAAGGFGIPTRTFRAWFWPWYLREITVSPRDANLTHARELAGIDDQTFEPAELFGTYCGGLDLITPAERGGMHLDKFFIYASYVDVVEDVTRLLNALAPDEHENRYTMNSALRLVQQLMSTVESEGAAYPIGTYRVGDGFVPLQSQLFLDGTETERIYETQIVHGWEIAAFPTKLREEIIFEHTLALPERLRILKGWSHLDTITGRYCLESGRSELFPRVVEDLLSVMPPPED
jgi:hypothetical protein